MNKSKTLYVTDLDGTLMRDDKTISEATASIINKLIDEGMLITYATARSIRSASVITKEIHFRLPVITLNGTIFVDPQTKQAIETVTFTENELQSLQKCIGSLNIPGFVSAFIDGESRKSYLEGLLNEGFQYYLDSHADDKRLRAVQAEAGLYEGQVCCFTFIAEKEELEPLYQRVREYKVSKKNDVGGKIMTEIRYIELKTGYGDDGPAWIGKVKISRSGNTVYFNDHAFQRHRGISGNFIDIESGDEYWISGVKKNGEDRHWAGNGKIIIDSKIIPEYLEIVGEKKLNKTKFIVENIEDIFPVERIRELLNG